MLHKKIIFGITGSISAYKACEIIRLLKKEGADIQVVITKSAKKFIQPLTLQALSGNPVLEDIWNPSENNGMDHINLTRDADLIVIAPTSANFIAKLSYGLADDLLSNLCLARNCKLLIAPAMNKEMWENPATQRNILLLIKDKIIISGPEKGEQACGEEGMGRLVHEQKLLLDIQKSLSKQIFKNKNFLISVGSTVEKIDDVRAITNLSSGRMGFAIAYKAYMLGANVTIVYGRVDINIPYGINSIYAPTHSKMKEVIKKNAPKNDVFISVAAISDYLPSPVKGKIKKNSNKLNLELKKSDDILSEISKSNKKLFCVGFSAENERIIKNSQLKLKNKNLDMVIANSINESMGKKSTELYIIDQQEVIYVPKKNKKELSGDILQHIHKLINQKDNIYDFIN